MENETTASTDDKVWVLVMNDKDDHSIDDYFNHLNNSDENES